MKISDEFWKPRPDTFTVVGEVLEAETWVIKDGPGGAVSTVARGLTESDAREICDDHNAKVVQMRRNWTASRWTDGRIHVDGEDCGHGGWSDVTGEPKDFVIWCHEMCFGDPSKALTEAELWYESNTEAEKKQP